MYRHFKAVNFLIIVSTVLSGCGIVSRQANEPELVFSTDDKRVYKRSADIYTCIDRSQKTVAKVMIKRNHSLSGTIWEVWLSGHKDSEENHSKTIMHSQHDNESDAIMNQEHLLMELGCLQEIEWL